MKERILALAKACGADVVGFAPASRFAEDDPVFRILPQTKTVIGLAFRVLRGAYRGIEEGSTFYQYTTMGVENMEETVMPMALLRVANLLEEEGFVALPQRRHQQIVPGEEDTSPEMVHQRIYRGKKKEVQMDFLAAAVTCGLGERGLHNALLTEDFGPMVRYCFLLTNAALSPDEIPPTSLCDRCGKCVAACPGKAIDATGRVDPWQCAVYYKGANGARNPFLPKDAFATREDRLALLAGEARLSPQSAKEILEEPNAYPHVSHSYESSLCGRACDVACYVHLEERGVLKKRFKSPFRKRPEWKLDLDFFQKEEE